MNHSRAEVRLVGSAPAGPQLAGERAPSREPASAAPATGPPAGPDRDRDRGSGQAARTWAERDAAVVWHGFTQMAAYTGNAPLVIERAEGRELIDADGRRYLDAISSLWVNTLGHRVPELDAALAAQAAKVAHSTMLGNGNTVVVELAEALAPVVPVDDPHFLFAADGAVAVEQALKIAFQYWVNRGVDGRTSLPRARRCVPRRHHRLALARRRWRVQRRLRPAVLPRRAHAGLRRPGLGRQGVRGDRGPRRGAGGRRDRAAGAGCLGHVVRLRGRCAAARRGVPPGRHAAHLRRGGDRVRADRDVVRLRAVRRAARPHVRGQGHHRWVPGHVGHGGVGRGVRRVPRRRPRAGDLLPRAFLRRECVGGGGRARAPAPVRGVGRAGERAGARRAVVLTAWQNGSPVGPKSAKSVSAG